MRLQRPEVLYPIQRLVCYLSKVGFGEFPVELVKGVLTEYVLVVVVY